MVPQDKVVYMVPQVELLYDSKEWNSLYGPSSRVIILSPLRVELLYCPLSRGYYIKPQVEL